MNITILQHIAAELDHVFLILIKPDIKANKQGHAAKSIVAELVHLTWQSVSCGKGLEKM